MPVTVSKGEFYRNYGTIKDNVSHHLTTSYPCNRTLYAQAALQWPYTIHLEASAVSYLNLEDT